MIAISNADRICTFIAEIGGRLLFFNVSPIKNFDIPFLIFWLVGSCFYFTYKLQFLNLIKLPEAVMLFLKDKKSVNHKDNTASSKAIVLSAIAGATDLGSIFGVATIVSIGGAGTIFWMIVAGVLSTSLRFIEALCGHFFRKKIYSNGVFCGFHGGPQVYIKRIFNLYKLPRVGNIMAKIYAFNVAISTFCSLQVNQTVNITTTLLPQIKEYQWLVSLVIALLIISIAIRGFAKIATLNAKIIPTMVTVYLLMTLCIIAVNYQNLIPSINLVIKDAFSFKAISGSFSAIIILGTQRAFFCNEAGMGSGGIIHANSSNKNSYKEAIISMITPIISVLIVCSCSGLIILTTGVYQKMNSEQSGIEFIIQAFASVNPHMKYLIILIIPLFAITTAIAWAYYGSRSWIALFGKKYVSIYYLILFICYYLCGLVTNFETILNVADILNLSISIPNIIALIMFVKIGAKFKKLKTIFS